MFKYEVMRQISQASSSQAPQAHGLAEKAPTLYAGLLRNKLTEINPFIH
jgi:hypothetical protein